MMENIIIIIIPFYHFEGEKSKENCVVSSFQKKKIEVDDRQESGREAKK
jgi:hypothetical protein